jgi:PAS domain S-box-containing protein
MESVKIDEMLANPDLARYRTIYTAGQVIFLEGDGSQDLYILVAGQIEIYKGDKKIREIHKVGSVFGEVSFFLGDKRTASVKAINSVEVIRIPKEEIILFLNEFPAAAREITLHLAQWLSETSQIIHGLKELCDQLPEAVILSDKDGKILMWNAAAERLYGRDWSQMRSIQVADIYSQPREYRDFLQKVQDQYAIKENFFEIIHPKKGARTVCTSFTVLYDGHHNFRGVLSLGRDVTAAKNLEKKYKRVFTGLISAFVLIGLLTAAIFWGYPYFSKGHRSVNIQQQELRNLLAKDYVLLSAWMAEHFTGERNPAIDRIMQKFFDIQQTVAMPYTGLVLLDTDKKVLNAYSTEPDSDAGQMVGSSYAAIEFEGKEPSPHRVLTVYRSAKNHPMGKKGYEIAFALNRDGNLVGWLIFQLNMESLSKQNDINARRLIELKFDRL